MLAEDVRLQLNFRMTDGTSKTVNLKSPSRELDEADVRDACAPLIATNSFIISSGNAFSNPATELTAAKVVVTTVEEIF